MTCRTEIVEGEARRFCPDPSPIASDRVRAVLRARVIDEITTEPVAVDISVTTESTLLFPRAAEGGLIGLVGQPARVFPGLDVTFVNLAMRVAAPGYLNLDLGGTLGPIAGFPGVFAPLDLGSAGLHRIPVEFLGRTLRRNSLTPIVVAGALIRIDGYWATFPPAGVSPPAVMSPPDLVNLSPGCYAARETPSGTLRARAITPIAGQDKNLRVPAGRGATRIQLTNRSTLAVGSTLIIDDGNPAIREYMVVSFVDTSSGVDEPAWITLAHSIAHTHLDGAFVRVGNPQVPGIANAITRPAIPGDATVFLGGLAGLVAGGIVELSDAFSAPEYHQLSLYETVSDADGYFRLPPIARVAMILLHSQRLPLAPPADARITPDYRVAENRITVMFP